MKQGRRWGVCLLAAVLAFACFFVTPRPVEAAAVQTNVVKQVKHKSHNGEGYFVTKLAYNKMGLVSMMGRYDLAGKLQLKTAYKYDASNLVKSAVIYEYGTRMATVAYTYDSKKQLTKRVTKYTNAPITITAKFGWKNGKIVQCVTTYQGDCYYPSGTKITETFAYNSKGVLSRRDTVNSSDAKAGGTEKYAYDAKGNLKKFVYKTGYPNGRGTTVRTLVYKNGLLVKYRDSDTINPGDEPELDQIRYITWGKITASSKVSEIAARQQTEILNDYYCFPNMLANDYI